MDSTVRQRDMARSTTTIINLESRRGGLLSFRRKIDQQLLHTLRHYNSNSNKAPPTTTRWWLEWPDEHAGFKWNHPHVGMVESGVRHPRRVERELRNGLFHMLNFPWPNWFFPFWWVVQKQRRMMMVRWFELHTVRISSWMIEWAVWWGVRIEEFPKLYP